MTFSEFLFAKFNDIILTLCFPEQLKYADVKLYLRTSLVMVKEIIERSVLFLTFLKYIKDFYTNNQKLIFNLCYLDVYVDSGKELVY